MRRSVAVSKGTFFVGSGGVASVGGSCVLFRFCSASITERALASESLRGRVAIGFGSGVANGVPCLIVGSGDDWGPNISLLGGRIDFRLRRLDWETGTECATLSSPLLASSPALGFPRP